MAADNVRDTPGCVDRLGEDSVFNNCFPKTLLISKLGDNFSCRFFPSQLATIVTWRSNLVRVAKVVSKDLVLANTWLFNEMKYQIYCLVKTDVLEFEIGST